MLSFLSFSYFSNAVFSTFCIVNSSFNPHSQHMLVFYNLHMALVSSVQHNCTASFFVYTVCRSDFYLLSNSVCSYTVLIWDSDTTCGYLPQNSASSLPSLLVFHCPPFFLQRCLCLFSLFSSVGSIFPFKLYFWVASIIY